MLATVAPLARSAACVAGGALYGEAGSCVASLFGNAFAGNGNLPRSANGTASGGAVALTSPSCGLSVSRCTFRRNAAAAGGALAVSCDCLWAVCERCAGLPGS
jgi:hypothetical protein